MKSVIFCLSLLILPAAPAPSFAQQQTSPHDCCDIGDCPGTSANHEAETYQGTLPPDSCIATNSSAYWCLNPIGISAWTAYDNTWSQYCEVEGFADGTIACGRIWCSNGSGGWALKNVGVKNCPGKLQTDASGIKCFFDNNGDDRYSPGDTIYSNTGC